MGTRPSILHAFINLGNFLRDFCDTGTPKNDKWSSGLEEVIHRAKQENGWFTKENVLFSLAQWGKVLTQENLENWLAAYTFAPSNEPRKIAVIMAGNIPLVGFHDFMCVLVTGNQVLAKLSSSDRFLLPFVSDYLISKDASLADKIRFTEGKLESFDAVIATGSNNTGRYFEYYFGKRPHIIRKNRNSIAVLDGNEPMESLKALGQDIFQYFGLGCRSVSKLFVPEDYDFRGFFEAIFEYQFVIDNHKYANNYDYNKAVFLMSNFKILDNNFLLLKEDNNYGSPIGTLYFEWYSNIDMLAERLTSEKEHLQCIVSNSNALNGIDFGTTQKPSLMDYADGIDTIQFLLTL